MTCVVLVAAASARAEWTAVMSGIAGDVADGGMPTMTSPISSVRHGTKTSTSGPGMQELTITRPAGPGSPAMLEALAKQAGIDSVVLESYVTVSTGRVLSERITLSGVVLTSVSMNFSQASGVARTTETWTLRFSRVVYEVRPSSGAALVKIDWNLKSGEVL